MTRHDLLDGRYALHRIVGHGGMAKVWKGEDVQFGRPVAVKVLRSDLCRDPVFRARFAWESQALASLSHPGIVSFYGSGVDVTDDNPVPYMVMEYVEGSTFREVLGETDRVAPDRALELTAQVLAALAYSHRLGIVHRDVKPANVMMTSSGTVKVLDFGISRAIAEMSSHLTEPATAVGTAQYLSPEQARGKPVDGRSDIYAVGCMLYELLTGRAPFLGDSPLAVALQQVEQDPPAPSDIADVPQPHAAIAMRALQKSPGRRYQNADEMVHAINAVLAGSVADTEVASAPEPVRRASVIAGPVGLEARHTRPVSSSMRGKRAYAFSAVAVLAVVAAIAGVVQLVGPGQLRISVVPPLHEPAPLALAPAKKPVPVDRPADSLAPGTTGRPAGDVGAGQAAVVNNALLARTKPAAKHNHRAAKSRGGARGVSHKKAGSAPVRARWAGRAHPLAKKDGSHVSGAKRQSGPSTRGGAGGRGRHGH
ncbi:protein kinase [Actinopolymorpha sp. NPDC004070]|uniref:protein kinase domain-containing protein n=1 Tax=Actinopolymorpha sp. NPDC004070 TaxID=3154548 RepID=UPI0033B9E36E